MSKAEINPTSFEPPYNPEDVIHFTDDKSPLPGGYTIYPDNDLLLGAIINNFLLRGSPRQARVIVYEDGPITAGVWTPDQAEAVCRRLALGADGNLRDPKETLGQKAYATAAELTEILSPIIIPVLGMIIREEE